MDHDALDPLPDCVGHYTDFKMIQIIIMIINPCVTIYYSL